MIIRLFFGLLFTLFLSCNSDAKDLPVLSYAIDNSGNKRVYKITYENFRNQSDETFSTEMIQGKICIANFFFTRCPSICPPMRTKLISIAEAFSESEKVLLISHTIDPKHDSISILKNYSEATGVPDIQWQFVRASEEQTKQQAELYMTNFKPNEDGSDFYHSSFVALLDEEQQIRGFYNILIKEDFERLKRDIQILLS